MTSTPVRPALSSGPRPMQTARTPYLMLDVDLALSRYRTLRNAFGPRAVHYAVKANPHPALVTALADAGGRFDVASSGEVDLCLAAGADAAHLVYSNPMKRRSDIEYAYGRGVTLFVADSLDEVIKLSTAAPGSDVLIRLATSGSGSDWPLSGKFGCSVDEAVALLTEAGARGLGAAGLAFHVGSQQRDPQRWDPPVAAAATVFGRLRQRGLSPWLLDIGGGLPAAHEGDHPAPDAYPAAIGAAIRRHFPGWRPEVIIEPGRGIVGDAGTIVSEVLGVTWRGGRRWVYLDVGVYTGLVETLGESIRYRLETDHTGADLGPAVLAGPTCDSVDVLYENVPVMLPLSLTEGDQVRFTSAGAYTTSYSTVGFNGFAPLATYLV
ncbi:MAG: type III PLP-dependent enzyme [Propionibacteriaceae bacterium]